MRWKIFREELEGPFFDDWIDSATHLKQGLWDGDHWIWNLVMHPLQGGISYHAARSRGAPPWESFLWGVAYSFHFELSPLGQAGIGNIRVSPLDLLLTPTAGVLWVKLEAWLDSRIDRLPGETDRRFCEASSLRGPSRTSFEGAAPGTAGR